MEIPLLLETPHGGIRLPAFLPDATRGVVRGVDSAALAELGVSGLVMSLFHLLQRPAPGTLKALGGLHRFFGWRSPIITDSGGFQAWSLISQNPSLGSITERGLVYKGDLPSPLRLTPEQAVERQFVAGADVIICLDQCTHASDPPAVQRAAVERTLAWARLGKAAYVRLTAARPAPHPQLFGVIQGGTDRELRHICAEGLLEIGFDGYGLGGWPLDAQNQLLTDTIAWVRELVPREFPLHALGVGHPTNVVTCSELGYSLFDSAMPTRDARHGRLLVWQASPHSALSRQAQWFRYLYIGDADHRRSSEPVDETCPCPACLSYSRAWLHHLFKIGDSLYQRYATLHNLAFMLRLMERLRDDAAA
ncbi:MAG: tRNA-guanine transglycosylase [Chloroflexi bacterium]|nr:tRNA-guanine transglycosylase [Chloroflexota bacterium]